VWAFLRESKNVPRGTTIASAGAGFWKKLWFKMWFLDGLRVVFLWFWRTTHGVLAPHADQFGFVAADYVVADAFAREDNGVGFR